MKYRVIGASRDTGARQILELAAESKAAAERKAMQSGMTVTRVEDITDGAAAHAYQTGSATRNVTVIHPVLKLIILIAVALAGYYMYRGTR
jgi:hypothetical protein